MPTYYGLAADHNVEQLKLERHETDFLFMALREACLFKVTVPIKRDAKCLSLSNFVSGFKGYYAFPREKS